MAAASNFVCACYFERNIFLRKYNIHVEYASDVQFRKAYLEVQEEVQRRKNSGKSFMRTVEAVKTTYSRCHPDIYHLKEEYLCPEFLDAVAYSKLEGASTDVLVSKLTVEQGENVYSLPLFTDWFCTQLLEELNHYEECPIEKNRPNTMNRHGILLSELGFDEFLDALRETYIMPLCRLLYSEWLGPEGKLDSHRAFTVKYSLDGDTNLSYHYDNAEVTLNVCIGKQFTGGDLLFGKMWGVPCERQEMTRVRHWVGRGVLHCGRHMHLATPLEDGDRSNLIIWMRSSSLRRHECPMCHSKPRLVPFDGPGAGFVVSDRKSPFDRNSLQ